MHNFILRIPYLIEDNFGIDTRFYCAQNAPALLITLDERRLVKNNELDELKSIVLRELISVDDPIDIYSKHTMLHDAVIMERQQIFYFLL